jgi:hypothetical protein
MVGDLDYSFIPGHKALTEGVGEKYSIFFRCYN